MTPPSTPRALKTVLPFLAFTVAAAVTLWLLFGRGEPAQATPNEIPSGATIIIRHGPGELGWSFGHGHPSGECLPGALYSNVDGKALDTLYVCEAGTWKAK